MTCICLENLKEEEALYIHLYPPKAWAPKERNICF